MLWPTPDAGRDSSPIDFERLEGRVAPMAAEFAEASPWRHIVIDGFLRGDVAERAAARFPRLRGLRLARFLEARVHAWTLEPQDPAIAAIFDALQSERFTAWLRETTGIADLSVDSQFVGAGLHQGAGGSYLRLHADHNTHPGDAQRFRRINLLLYLNDFWESQWNGDLEIWDRDAGACRKRIEPALNRCVLLAVDDTAYHGYGPLRLPAGRTRKAIVAYYYSSAPAPGQAVESHPTLLPPVRGESPLSAFAHFVRRAILYRIQKLTGK